MKHIAKTTIFLLVLALLSGCAVSHTFGPYKGKVVDAETEEPIEGAVLFMEFTTRTPNPGGATASFADAKEVLTDKNGEFFLEHTVTTLRPGQHWDPWPNAIVFKPGYGVFPGKGTRKGTSITPKPPKPSWGNIGENIYSIIKLPKLHTKEERNYVLLQVSVGSEVPYEKRKNISELKRQERIYLGYKP
jgi:hypothetical protein